MRFVMSECAERPLAGRVQEGAGRRASPRLAVSILAAVVLASAGAPLVASDDNAPNLFTRGDVNMDRRTSLADVFLILRYLWAGSSVPCKSAADVDDDGRIHSADALLLLDTIFYDHSPPREPFLKAGTDPTPDGLGCRKGLSRSPEPRALDEGAGGQRLCDGNGLAADLDFIHFQAGRLLAYPGEERIRVPVLLNSNYGKLEGFTLSLHSDSKLVRLDAIDFAGTPIAELEPSWLYVSDQKVQDGYLAASVGLSTRAPFRTLPPFRGESIAILELSISPEAPVGSRARVHFKDKPGENGRPPIMNEVSRNGFTQPHDACGFEVEIVSGEGVFVRGDASRDRSINIIDAVYILKALFGGSLRLSCPDAADVNDDGTVNLSDPIHLVRYLFGQYAAPAHPFPEAGRDPTSDTLACSAPAG